MQAAAKKIAESDLVFIIFTSWPHTVSYLVIYHPKIQFIIGSMTCYRAEELKQP